MNVSVWKGQNWCNEAIIITDGGRRGLATGPATGHMVVRHAQITSRPWENSPFNPLIRAKDSSEKWWSVGHGTLFADVAGKWWIVFHGYENGHQNMGRQTLLQPVEWTSDGWYKIPDGIKTDEPIKRPSATASAATFSLSDNFDGDKLRLHWKFFGEYDADRFYLADNSLVIKARGFCC
ncbi:MAG: family 43 glycosylhydrolase [Chloroflexota bacterium]